jgi:hypothetical protein
VLVSDGVVMRRRCRGAGTGEGALSSTALAAAAAAAAQSSRTGPIIISAEMLTPDET